MKQENKQDETIYHTLTEIYGDGIELLKNMISTETPNIIEVNMLRMILEKLDKTVKVGKYIQTW